MLVPRILTLLHEKDHLAYIKNHAIEQCYSTYRVLFMKKNLIKKKTFNRLQKSTLHFENQLNNIYHGWFLYWDVSKDSYVVWIHSTCTIWCCSREFSFSLLFLPLPDTDSLIHLINIQYMERQCYEQERNMQRKIAR